MGNELRDEGGRLIDANYDWVEIKGPIATLTQVGQVWRPIETAHQDGTVVDLWAGGQRRTDCYWKDGCWLQMNPDDACASFLVLEPPTHWMPLPPEPPK
jgi:hypothetical protein